MGLPLAIKTDNGPAYTSAKFANFCELWKINHTTGIPYNPQDQAIGERDNATLKEQLQKQKGETVRTPTSTTGKSYVYSEFFEFLWFK